MMKGDFISSIDFQKQFSSIYQGKTILVTGHTGFKGSWLTYWLHQLGAKVIGYSKDIPTDPNHFELLELNNICTSYFADMTDFDSLRKVIKENKPDIIFHLAAQSLVRYSYANPLETLSSNIMGTTHLLESCRQEAHTAAIVNVTSDKCYENLDERNAFNEEHPMGGFDPYSCSKGVSELITNCYRNSFFQQMTTNSGQPILLASARAGNVIGGGDWAEDRLIPDIVRATTQEASVLIRSPRATRPWQHVLEPLSGYLLLGQRLLEGKIGFAEGWNFGPLNRESLAVSEVLHIAQRSWSKIQIEYQENKNQAHEAKFLRLDCSKANQILDWKPVWTTEQAIEKTIDWYQDFYQNKNVTTKNNLLEYSTHAFRKGCQWAINSTSILKSK